MQPLRQLAFVVNGSKAGAWDLARRLHQEVEHDIDSCEMADGQAMPVDFLRGRDACCVIGGDGTILGVVAQAVHFGVPVIGINHGKLGFLTTYTQEEAVLCLPDLISGQFTVTHRALLSCRTADGQEALALNDVVVRAAPYTGLVDLQVLLNGRLVNTFTSDGLIFATPTGSTAYNLAAGGPLVHPATQAIVMTPISPHTLSNRSVVFSCDATLTVNYSRGEGLPQVNLDGGLPFGGEPAHAFPLQIFQSPRHFQLLHPPGYDHFAIVRSKLRW